MESFFNAVSAVMVVMLMTLVGFMMGRLGWMKPEHKPFMVKLIISIGMPCMCINNIQERFTREMLDGSFVLLLAPLAAIAAAMLASAFVGRRLGLPERRLYPFIVMGGLSNSVFIGYPMCLELFGEACVPYVMFFYLVNTAVFQIAGVWLISRGGSGSEGLFSWGTIKKVVTNPPFAAIMLSIALLLLDIRLPETVMSVTGYFGDTVSPLALIYSGFVLHETGLRALRPDRIQSAMMGLRFVFSPLICIAICAVLGIGGLCRSVFVVEAAMPVMTQCVVMSGKFGADEEFAAKGAAISIVASFIVIPVLMLVM